MDPATLASLVALANFGVELEQQYRAGLLTTDQVQALLAQSGINVDAAVTAWEAVKAGSK